MSSVTLTVTVLHPKSAEGQLPPPISDISFSLLVSKRAPQEGKDPLGLLASDWLRYNQFHGNSVSFFPLCFSIPSASEVQEPKGQVSLL